MERNSFCLWHFLLGQKAEVEQATQQGDATARQNGQDTHSGSILSARIFGATRPPGADPPHFIARCSTIICDESRSAPLHLRIIWTLLYYYAFSWPHPKSVDDAGAK